MKRRLAILTALLLLGAYLFGCDSADNPIAPTGSTLTVSASPSQIDLGGSSTISITGFRPDGNPLNPGTQLTITATIGRIMVRDVNGALVPGNIVEVGEAGRATAQLESDGRQGPSTVTVSLTGGGDGASAMVDVQIGIPSTDLPTVTVDANPTEIALNASSTITVTARQADGSALTSGDVSIRTNLGTLTGSSGSGTSITVPITSSSGVVTAELSSNQAGTATVTASVGASAEVMATVEIGTTLKPVVTLSANPSSLRVGEISEITIFARDSNGNLLQDDATAVLTADRGELQQGGNNVSSVTLRNGTAKVDFLATGPAGEGNVTAFVGNSDSVSVAITVRVSPDNIVLQVSQNNIDTDGPTQITLTATVSDDDFNLLSGIPVTFFIDPANIPVDFSENPRVSGSNGEAVIRANFEGETIPDGITVFNLGARAGNIQSDPVPITVGAGGGGGGDNP